MVSFLTGVECPNCGSTKIVEVDGVPTCLSCGSKLPDVYLGELGGIDQKIKEAEIIRLYNARTKRDMEPKMNILSDDEILKYAPNSEAAEKIRFNRANTLYEKLKASRKFRIIFTIVLMAIVMAIGNVISLFNTSVSSVFAFIFILIPIVMYFYFK